MRDEIKCPITLGEYERYVKNKAIFDSLPKEKRDWVEYFMFTYEYLLSDFVMKLVGDELWVIINTGKTVKEFKI